MIPYGRQSISEEDIGEVVRVLRSDFLTQGPEIPAFESELVTYCGAAHGVAVNSATSALHIACMALGVGPGDLVWTSPLTFVASSNCALYCGAQVDFVDIDPRTYNMSVDSLALKLEESAKIGRTPKVVIPVHFSGQPCDMQAIHDLAVRYGFKVIEDASHAIGGSYRGAPIGNCRYSDITVFSFHPVKIITTTEGGMAVTNDDRLAKLMRLARSHGITRDQAEMTEPSHGGWYYQQVSLGFNYRLTDVQAALGRSQLRRVDQFVKRRTELAARYDEAFAGYSITTPWQHPDSGSAWHLYVVRFGLGHVRFSHREIFDRLRADNIGVNLHYIPVYLQPYYAALGFRSGHCPNVEKYYAEAVSLPLYAGLADSDQDVVIAAVKRILGN